MIKKINDIIAKASLIILLAAGTEKLVFWIINVVDNFKWKVGSGVQALFQGCFEMVLDLVILAILLAVSVKISGVKPIGFGPDNSFPDTTPHYPAQQPPMQQYPVQQTPVQQAPVQQNMPAQGDSNWYCQKCGAGNDQSTNFCKNCGKPRQ